MMIVIIIRVKKTVGLFTNPKKVNSVTEDIPENLWKSSPSVQSTTSNSLTIIDAAKQNEEQ